MMPGCVGMRVGRSKKQGQYQRRGKAARPECSVSEGAAEPLRCAAGLIAILFVEERVKLLVK